jgi:hypothetical protein
MKDNGLRRDTEMTEDFIRPVVAPKAFFTDDVWSLSHADKDKLTQFIVRLTRNPYSDAIQSEVQSRGKYYASPVDDMVVYWTVNPPDLASGDPETISLLKVAHLHELQALAS